MSAAAMATTAALPTAASSSAYKQWEKFSFNLLTSLIKKKHHEGNCHISFQFSLFQSNEIQAKKQLTIPIRLTQKAPIMTCMHALCSNDRIINDGPF